MKLIGKHFVHTLAEYAKPHDPMRYFSTIKTRTEKRIIYFTSVHIILVFFKDGVQTGVQVKVRAPNQSLLVEEGKIEKELGVFAAKPSWRTAASARALD